MYDKYLVTGATGFLGRAVADELVRRRAQVYALVLHDDKKKTLPILIAQLRGADWLKFDMGQVYVMITFSILPVIVVYLILSKHIVQGVALGSVKG